MILRISALAALLLSCCLSFNPVIVRAAVNEDFSFNMSAPVRFDARRAPDAAPVPQLTIEALKTLPAGLKMLAISIPDDIPALFSHHLDQAQLSGSAVEAGAIQAEVSWGHLSDDQRSFTIPLLVPFYEPFFAIFLELCPITRIFICKLNAI